MEVASLCVTTRHAAAVAAGARLTPNGFIVHNDRGILWKEFDFREVELVRAWLQGKTRTMHPRRPTSYWWKHVAENEVGEYVSNGAFILACLLEDVPVKRIGYGLNAEIGLSRRAWAWRR